MFIIIFFQFFSIVFFNKILAKIILAKIHYQILKIEILNLLFNSDYSFHANLLSNI